MRKYFFNPYTEDGYTMYNLCHIDDHDLNTPLVCDPDPDLDLIMDQEPLPDYIMDSAALARYGSMLTWVYASLSIGSSIPTWVYESYPMAWIQRAIDIFNEDKEVIV